MQFDSAEYLYEKQRYLISWYPYIKVVNSPIGGAVVKAQMDAAEVGRIFVVRARVHHSRAWSCPPPPSHGLRVLRGPDVAVLHVLLPARLGVHGSSCSELREFLHELPYVDSIQPIADHHGL